MPHETSSEIRARLPHPVVDADGHTVEYFPALLPLLQAEGVDLTGPSFARMESGHLGPPLSWHAHTPEERARLRLARGAWSGVAADPVDIATGVLPRLLHERLDELGIDVSIVYPSLGLLFLHIDDDRDRRGACRALNRFNAELYADLADRLVPVAVIPMHTPEEAVEELDHAVGELGHKAVVLAGFVQRPVPAVAESHPDVAPWALWTDTYGLDSQYDYDPVWRRCRELGVSPAFHSGAMGWQNRRSISSYVYNHVGMLGEAHHALAKSLLLGGVVRRFPELRFCFLEGGVAWGASLLADLVGHWEKRNVDAIRGTDPAQADWDAVAALYERHAGPSWAGMPVMRSKGFKDTDAALLDEWAASGVTSADDIVELFAPRFFFGCEADDPMTSTAFNTRVNPGGARLQALFGSDISHWDVPVMAEVLEEAWELVDEEIITADDFRDFTFANPVRFHTATNPAFFKGTRVEGAVDALLADEAAGAGAA